MTQAAGHIGPKTRFPQGTALATFWALVEQVSGQASAFIIFLVLARIISPGEYGVFSVSMAILGIFGVILYQGFGDAVIQREHIDEQHLSTAFWSDMGIACLVIIGLWCFSFFAGTLFGSPEIGPVIRLLSFTCLLRASVNVHLALFRRDLRMAVFALRTVLGSGIGVAVGIVMALRGWGVWSLVGSQLLQGFTIGVVVWTRSKWRPRMLFSRTAFRDLAGFSRHIMLASIITSLNGRLDTLLIGAFLNVTAVGYYALAIRLIEALNLLSIAPLSRIVIPILSRWKNRPDKVGAIYIKMVIAATTAWLPCAIGLGVTAPTLLPLVFGPRWVDAVPLLQTMCFGAFSIGLTGLTGQTLSAMGRPDLYVRLAAVQLVASGVLFALVAKHGILAVGYAWLVLSLAAVPVHLVVVYQVMRFDLGTLAIKYACIVLGGLAMVLCMKMFESYRLVGTWPLLAEGVLGLAAFLISLEVLMRRHLRTVLNFVPHSVQ